MTPKREAPKGKRKLPPPKATAVRPDWTLIRAQWESNLLSDRQIAAQSTAAGRKVSHVAIGKKARVQGWERKPLTERVRAEVQRRLVAEQVSKDAPTPEHVEQVIDVAARQGVEVIREHRTAIKRTKTVAERLLEQLEDATIKADELVEAAVRVGEKDAEMRARLMRAAGLQSRVTTAKDLVQTVRNLIGLERQAFNLNDTSAQPDSIEERLARLEQA